MTVDHRKKPGKIRKAQDMGKRALRAKVHPPQTPIFRVSARRPKFDIGIDTEVKGEAMAMYMVRKMERDVGFDKGSGSRHQTPARNRRDRINAVVLAKSGHE